MKVCETFVGFQGEINVGRFAFFIRLAKCNLNCTWCDSKYAQEEYVDINIDDLVSQAIHFPRVVITGGEPFLQKDDVAKLVKKIKTKNPDIVIEIETNGTIKPVAIGSFDIIFNVSLKMKNSLNEYEHRIIPDVINWFNEVGANFKFVVAEEDDIDEVSMLVKSFGIKKSHVFLMPEGKTKEEQFQRMEGIMEQAKIYGYNFSPRFHVLMFGNKRGV